MEPIMAAERRYSQPSFTNRRRSSVGLLVCLLVSCLLPLVAAKHDHSIPSSLADDQPSMSPVPNFFSQTALPSNPAIKMGGSHGHKHGAVHSNLKRAASPAKTTSSSSTKKTSSTSSVKTSSSTKISSSSKVSSSTKATSSSSAAQVKAANAAVQVQTPTTSSSSKVSSTPSSSKVSSTPSATPTLNPGQANDKPSKIVPPTASDVFRYRYQYGANLGSVWVLERWLFPGMFPNGTTANLTSELAAVQAWIAKVGINQARSIFESHWADAIEDDDLSFIADTAKANAVRVPIGFFTLGSKYCTGTPFEPVAALYQNSWTYVKQAVQKINSRGVGVLIDFHALPGGANTGDHSGTNSGQANFWGSTQYKAMAQDALNFILSEAKSAPGVLGVQVVNEAIYDASTMYQWYDTLLAGFVTVDNTMPIYISDGWDLPTAIKYVKTKNLWNTSYNPVVIDTHMYYAFTQDDWNSTPQQIIAEVPSQLDAVNGQNGAIIPGGGVDIVVGEWSDVMDDQTWNKRGTSSIQDLTIQFGKAQNKVHQAKAAGEFFWSMKMDPSIYYGGWCFDVQTKMGSISAPALMQVANNTVTQAIVYAQSKANATMTTSYNNHVNYWKQQMPQMTFEHWRFQSGWWQGFNDSIAFAGARGTGKLYNAAVGADRIGFLDGWARKRIIESGMQGNFVWEFEMGLRKGIADFGTLVGAY